MKIIRFLPLFTLFTALYWFSCKVHEMDEPTDSCPNPPVAAFTPDKLNGDAPLTVQFNNNSTGATSYQWFFGNNQTSTDHSPSFTFQNPGNYPVVLIAAANGTCRDTFVVNISVNMGLPTVACFTYTKNNGGISPSTVDFNSACSQNAGSYLWDFGHLDSLSGQNFSSTEANPSHVFTHPGRYAVKLTTQNNINSDQKTEEVVICGPNSSLVNDTCVCNSGYEPDAQGNCTIENRLKFLGNYLVSEDCSLSFPSNYSVTITAGAVVDEVKISNFWGIFFNPVRATVSGNSISIANQEPDQDAFWVQGSGSIDTSSSPAVITLSYTVTDGNSVPTITDVCTNTLFIKQ